MLINHCKKSRATPRSIAIVFAIFTLVIQNAIPLPTASAASSVPVNIDYTLRGTINDCGIMQGGATDGQYLYYICATDNSSRLHIVKVTPEGTIVNRSKNFTRKQLGHANDMTYNSNLGLLVVSTWDYGGNGVKFIDPATYEIKKSMSTSDGSSTSNLCYNNTTNQYVVGGKVYDEDFKYTGKRLFTPAGVDDDANTTTGKVLNQGVECNSSYIYVMRVVWGENGYNVIVAYDWSGNSVGTYKISNLNDEGENMAIVNGAFYVGINEGSMSKGGNSNHDYFISVDGIIGTTDSGVGCTSALDETIALQYKEWGIGYYGNECVCSETSGIGGDNKDYAGNQVLSDDQMQKVTENQPFYESSAKKHNIPWQIIAAIHLRESGLSRTGPSNGQGPYQDFGRRNIPASLKSGSGWKVGSYSNDEFQTATDWAAEHIKTDYSLHPDKLATDVKEVKNLFFRYNGQAAVYKDQAQKLGFDRNTEGYEGSPYVMNRADAERDPTVEPTKSNNSWGQIKTDGGSLSYPANNDHGAFVVYAALGGPTSGATASSTDASGCPNQAFAAGSVEKLQSLAKAYTQDWSTSTTMSQTTAYKEVVKRSKYQPTCPGNDCGSFVYILMHESGWDTNYGGNSGQTDHMRAWFKNSQNGWSAVEGMDGVNPGSISIGKLLPGDVLWYSGHIYVFVGDMNGDGKQYFASASNCKRSPAFHTNIDTSGGATTVYRKTGGVSI